MTLLMQTLLFYRGWWVLILDDEMSVLILTLSTGTIRLWQTTPGKTYGLWQGKDGQ